MKIRNVIHKRLRRVILHDDSSGLPAAVISKGGKIVSFLQSLDQESELQTIPMWKAHQLTGDPNPAISPDFADTVRKSENVGPEGGAHHNNHPNAGSESDVMRPVASAPWIVALALSFSPASAQVAEGDPQQGKVLAQAWCSSCHLVSPQQQNAGNDAVPSFASVARMPSTTQMSLEAFLQSPHPPMPDLKLSRTQLDDVAAYILSLRKPG